MEPRPGLWKHFGAFLETGSDRFEVLLAALEEAALISARPVSVVTLAGNRHIFVSAERQSTRPVVLCAHYDRAADSPGANDNGAAVFMLMEAAWRLRAEGGENWLVVFTDKEELRPGEGLRQQGAYTLASALSRTFLRDASFFIFDSCGRGGTLVVSTTSGSFLEKTRGERAARALRRLLALRERAFRAAGSSGLERVQLLPTPFSDDAGFLRAGLVAQTLTALPAAEAAAFTSLARANTLYPASLVSRAGRAEVDLKRLPETWHLLNTPADTASTLTPKHWPTLIRLAMELCREPKM